MENNTTNQQQAFHHQSSDAMKSPVNTSQRHFKVSFEMSHTAPDSTGSKLWSLEKNKMAKYKVGINYVNALAFYCIVFTFEIKLSFIHSRHSQC